MSKTIIISLGIASALSIDAFLACFAYSANQNKRISSIICTPIFIGVFHFIFPFFTFSFCSLFNEQFKIIGHYISGSIFLILGLFCLFSKPNNHPIFNFFGVFLLSISVSIDSLLVGISLSFEYNNIIIPAIIFGLTSFIVSLIAILLGRKICSIKVNCNHMASFIFFILGTLTILHIF